MKQRSHEISELVNKISITKVLKSYGCKENPTGNMECVRHKSKAKHSLSITDDKLCCCVSPNCDLKGDVFSVVAIFEGWEIKKDFPKIIQKACEIEGIEAPTFSKEKLKELQEQKKKEEIIKKSNKIFFERTKGLLTKVQDYIINKRKITKELLVAANLGYLPKEEWIKIKGELLREVKGIKDITYIDRESKEHLLVNSYFALTNRIIHPHYHNKDIIYFTGEIDHEPKDDETKYLKLNAHFSVSGNAEGYLLDSLNADNKDYIVFVEGYWDALALKLIGFPVLTFGTPKVSQYFTNTYYNKLKKFKKVITCFDTEENEAGLAGAKAFNQRLYELGCKELYIAELPKINEEKIDIEKFLHNFKTKEEKQKAIQKHVIQKTKNFKEFLAEELNVKSLQTMFDDGVPEIKWRVENIVPERGTVIFGGASGARKTWTAMQLALACASGTKFLDHFETKECTVLYVDEENGDITIPNRFHKLKKGHGLTKNFNNLFVSIFNNVKLDDDTSIETLNILIEIYKPKLVILDSMVRCMVGDENKSEDVRRIFDNLKPILTKHKDISFVILHHTVKTRQRHRGIDTLRGSGDFAAFPDVILMFNEFKGFVDVEIVKNRHIDRALLSGFSIKFEAINDEGDLKMKYLEENPEVRDVIQACKVDIREWLDEAKLIIFKSKQAIPAMKELGHTNNTIYSALNKLKKDKKLSKQTRGVWKYENPLVTVEEEAVEEE